MLYFTDSGILFPSIPIIHADTIAIIRLLTVLKLPLSESIIETEKILGFIPGYEHVDISQGWGFLSHQALVRVI